MNNDLIRCPAFCVKIIKDGKGNEKRTPGYLTSIDSENPSGKMFCTTVGCPFAYRDENNRDHFVDGTDLLKLPTQDPLVEVNL